MFFTVLCCFHAASVKANFDDSISKDRCFGNLKILYQGKPQPVCQDTLAAENVRNTICKELGCGNTGEPLEFFGPSNRAVGVSGLTCPEDSSTLATCTNGELKPCDLGDLKCSGRLCFKYFDFTPI